MKNIAIEGCIGSGKTSVLKELEKSGYCVEVQHFEEIQMLLKKFYKEKMTSKELYDLQTKIYDIYKETYNKKYEKKHSVRFIEGILSCKNVFSKISFEDKKINEDDYNKLMNYCDYKDMKIDGIINIYAHPHICKDRIENCDSRSLEKGIDINYLKKINMQYKKFFAITEIPIYTFESSDKNSVESIVSDIKKIIKIL